MPALSKELLMFNKLLVIVCLLIIMIPLIVLTMLNLIEHHIRYKRRKEYDNAERSDLES
jgi:hypothetical protein